MGKAQHTTCKRPPTVGIEFNERLYVRVENQRQGGLAGQLFNALVIDTIGENGDFTVIITIDIEFGSVDLQVFVAKIRNAVQSLKHFEDLGLTYQHPRFPEVCIPLFLKQFNAIGKMLHRVHHIDTIDGKIQGVDHLGPTCGNKKER